MPKNEQPKIGSNVFVIRNGKLLLGERKEGRCWKDGEWSLPGGHVELGESLKKTAKRELFEETGLVATDFTLIHIADDSKDYHYIHFGFLANDAEGEPKVTESDKFYRWEWFELDKLPSEIFIGNRALIKAFLTQKVFLDD